MSYDRGLVERVRDSLARLGERGIREKNVFGGWGFLVGTGAFVIVWTEGLLVKLAPDEYAQARALPGVEPFAPGGERPMGTWLVATPDTTADDLDLADWVGRGLRGVRAVPPARRRDKGASAPPAATPSSRRPVKRSGTAASPAAKRKSKAKTERPSAAAGSRTSATKRPTRAGATSGTGRSAAMRGASKGAARSERKEARGRPARRPPR
jgi:hypothetical protein